MRARKCCPRPETPPSRERLQRGRACEGAEIRWLLANYAKPGQLQRGRACEGAEMVLTLMGQCRDRLCFNGAAPVRARK